MDTESAAMHNLAGASLARRTTPASPDSVWAVVADGWTYPAWVVGASRMRSVDAVWPAEGAQLHHSIGTWPLLRDDRTSVLFCDPDEMRIVLRARVRPFGTQDVELKVDVGAQGTVVSMREDAVGGLTVLAPRPLRQGGLLLRNRETLHRLCLLAERGTHPDKT